MEKEKDYRTVVVCTYAGECYCTGDVENFPLEVILQYYLPTYPLPNKPVPNQISFPNNSIIQYSFYPISPASSLPIPGTVHLIHQLFLCLPSPAAPY